MGLKPEDLPLVDIIARPSLDQTRNAKALNLSAIFSKTGKGVQEASGKTSHLSRGARAVLSAIDGKTALSEVQKNFEKLAGPKFETLIQQLDIGTGRQIEIGDGDVGPGKKIVERVALRSDCSAAEPKRLRDFPGRELDCDRRGLGQGDREGDPGQRLLPGRDIEDSDEILGVFSGCDYGFGSVEAGTTPSRIGTEPFISRCL